MENLEYALYRKKESDKETYVFANDVLDDDYERVSKFYDLADELEKNKMIEVTKDLVAIKNYSNKKYSELDNVQKENVDIYVDNKVKELVVGHYDLKQIQIEKLLYYPEFEQNVMPEKEYGAIIGISEYGNIWIVNANGKVTCNDKVMAFEPNNKPVLKEGEKLEVTECGETAKSGMIIRVLSLTDHELNKLINALKKLREDYGFVKLEKDPINNDVRILTIKDKDKGYEEVGLINKTGIKNYEWYPDALYEQNKEFLDKAVKTLIDELKKNHNISDDDKSKFMQAIIENVYLEYAKTQDEPVK